MTNTQPPAITPTDSLDLARITMIEQILNRADLDDTEARARIARHCPHVDTPAIDNLIALHAEIERLTADCAGEAVTLQQEDELEALHYDLYRAIKTMVEAAR